MTAATRPPASTIAGPALAELVDATRPLKVEFGRYASACTLLIEALGDQPFGAPRAWLDAAVSQLDQRDVSTLDPFVRSRPQELPSCLCVLPHRTRAGFAPLADDLERIRSMPREQLLAQLPANGAWHEVARNPGRWLDRFVRAVQRACHGLEQPWRSAAGVLDRETERVGVATARGAERELIASAFPTELVTMRASRPAGAEPGAGLGMVPLLTGPHATHVWMVDGEITHIAYPIPAARRLLEHPTPAPAGLEALLGPQRARVLRQLDDPMLAGEIAYTLIAAPSAASHHLAILERAGLVRRERQGRRVLVHRTARGTQLLALYE
jgi:DNA-binding transcriptional ArsR family regulator